MCVKRERERERERPVSEREREREMRESCYFLKMSCMMKSVITVIKIFPRTITNAQTPNKGIIHRTVREREREIRIMTGRERERQVEGETPSNREVYMISQSNRNIREIDISRQTHTERDRQRERHKERKRQPIEPQRETERERERERCHPTRDGSHPDRVILDQPKGVFRRAAKGFTGYRNLHKGMRRDEL